jgi:hypothetical protein
MQPGCGDHVDQHIDAEQVDLATHQIGYAWLRHAEQLRGLPLTQSLTFDVVTHRHHQHRPELHILGLDRVVLNGVPYAGETFAAHAFSSLINSLFEYSGTLPEDDPDASVNADVRFQGFLEMLAGQVDR